MLTNEEWNAVSEARSRSMSPDAIRQALLLSRLLDLPMRDVVLQMWAAEADFTQGVLPQFSHLFELQPWVRL